MERLLYQQLMKDDKLFVHLIGDIREMTICKSLPSFGTLPSFRQRLASELCFTNESSSCTAHWCVLEGFTISDSPSGAVVKRLSEGGLAERERFIFPGEVLAAIGGSHTPFTTPLHHSTLECTVQYSRIWIVLSVDYEYTAQSQVIRSRISQLQKWPRNWSESNSALALLCALSARPNHLQVCTNICSCTFLCFPQHALLMFRVLLQSKQVLYEYLCLIVAFPEVAASSGAGPPLSPTPPVFYPLAEVPPDEVRFWLLSLVHKYKGRLISTCNSLYFCL